MLLCRIQNTVPLFQKIFLYLIDLFDEKQKQKVKNQRQKEKITQSEWEQAAVHISSDSVLRLSSTYSGAAVVLFLLSELDGLGWIIQCSQQLLTLSLHRPTFHQKFTGASLQPCWEESLVYMIVFWLRKMSNWLRYVSYIYLLWLVEVEVQLLALQQS